MVFMGGKLRLPGRAGFSNPDRSGRGLFGALRERAAKSASGRVEGRQTLAWRQFVVPRRELSAFTGFGT
jgi:hypothetical protein